MGQPGAGVPGTPAGPLDAVNAYCAVTLGALKEDTELAVTAYELVDGIPNGKNILTLNSNHHGTVPVTVVYADPVGPTLLIA